MDELTSINLSDQKLIELCKFYGSNAKDWLRKFAGLLPEVYKRRLYKKQRCVSIHEFAKKFAWMNERTDDKVLHLRTKLEGKPELLRLFESGKQGWSKLQRIASIATPENDKDLAEKVKTLPVQILEIYSREQQIGTLSPGGQVYNKIKISQPYKKITFSIHPKVSFALRLYKQKLEKIKKEPLCWNQVFYELLKLKKETITLKVCPKCAEEKAKHATSHEPPESVKRILKKKYGNKCAFPNCNKPFENFHHTKRYALHQTHENIVLLCQDHHDLVHAGFIGNEYDPPEKWRLREEPMLSAIDKKVQKFKIS